MNKHVYTFHDMLQNVSKMQALNFIAARGLVTLAKAHTKQESVWEGSGITLQGVDIPSDEVLVGFWSTGLSDAQDAWRDLGMNTESHDFKVPESRNHLFIEPNVGNDNPESDEDSSTELALEEENSVMISDTQLDCHMRHVMMDDDAEGENDHPTQKHSLQINVPGHGQVYKSTLISMLNSGGELSKDRLKRVQAPTVLTPVTDAIDNDEIALFADILVKYRNDYSFGRILRMYVTEPRKTEYVRPFHINQEQNPSLKLLVKLYNSATEGDRIYSYSGIEIEVSCRSVTGRVRMDYNSEDSLYYVDETTSETLKSLRLSSTTRRVRRENQAIPTIATTESVSTESDNRVVTIVEPGPNSHSRRRRRVVTILDQ